MSFLRTIRASNRRTGIGLMLAALALWVQLVAGSVANPHMAADMLSASAFSDALAATICHTTPSDDQNAPVQHHAPDCAICPICQAISQAQLLIIPPIPSLAAPLAMMVAVFVAPATQTNLRAVDGPQRARGPPTTL